MSKFANILKQYGAAAPMEMLSDVLSCMRKALLSSVLATNTEAKAYVHSMENVCLRATEMRSNRPIENVRVDELLDTRQELMSFIKDRGKSTAWAFKCAQDQEEFLEAAFDAGWNSPRFARARTWVPVGIALRGHHTGCGTIINFANDNDLSTFDFDDDQMAAWMDHKVNSQRNLVRWQDNQARSFLRGVSNAQLGHLFPHLTLPDKRSSPITTKLKDMLPSLCEEILGVELRRKTVPVDYGFTVKCAAAATVTGLILTLRQLCWCYENTPGSGRCESLLQIITKENVQRLIDLALQRGSKPKSTANALHKVRFLTQIDALFQSHRAEYDWFLPLLRTTARKPVVESNAPAPRKCISNEELATIPGLIHAQRKGSSGRELAYLVMQELCILGDQVKSGHT